MKNSLNKNFGLKLLRKELPVTTSQVARADIWVKVGTRWIIERENVPVKTAFDIRKDLIDNCDYTEDRIRVLAAGSPEPR